MSCHYLFFKNNINFLYVVINQLHKMTKQLFYVPFQNLKYFEYPYSTLDLAFSKSNRSNALCVGVEARKSIMIVLECFPKSDEEPIN